MSEPSQRSIDSLRRLARGLVYDRDRAEDLVQEAWLAALRTKAEVRGLGAWLAGAARHLASRARREERRRAERERAAARSEVEPSAADAAAHIEILQRLVDALNALDEPYRSAIVLRYLEDLPPREMARRLGLPVNTARTHVRRGLERLRRELDGENGRNRRELLAALVPLAGRVPWTVALGIRLEPAVLTGSSRALLLQHPLWVALGAALVLGVWLVHRGLQRSDPRATEIALASGSSAGDASGDARRGSTLEPARQQSLGREPVSSSSGGASATWVVRGHAFRDEGEPFPDLGLVGRVYAGPRAESTPLVEERFEADQAGDFAWALPPPADMVTVSVEPEPGDHLRSSAESVFVPGDPAPERWTVRAAPLDCTIRGLVRDPAGRAVAGARVQATNLYEFLDTPETVSDADGRYALRVPSGGQQDLAVVARGFALGRLGVEAARPGETPAPDLSLKPERRIRGRVVDRQGTPISGAVVSCSSEIPNSTTTDGSGIFELGTLPIEQLFLSATMPGYLGRFMEVPPENLADPIEVRLVRGVRLTGRVLAPDGTALWGASIESSRSRVEFSDREGRFVLEHMPSGRQTLSISSRRFAETWIDVEIPKGSDSFELDVQLAEPHSLGGTVMDEHGQPIPWATVFVSESSAAFWKFKGVETRTGPDGRFLVENLPDLKVKATVTAKGRARLEQVVPALDRDDLVLVMRPAAALAGTIVDGRSGAPISSFHLHVSFSSSHVAAEELPYAVYLGNRDVSFAAPDGIWQLDLDVAPDQVATLMIDAPGYVSTTVAEARTSLTPDPADLVIPLLTATLVRGAVLDKESGTPLAGARVRRFSTRERPPYLNDPHEMHSEALTGIDGRFELPNVPTEDMSLLVEHPDRIPTIDGPFPVNGSSPIERRIELGRGATLRGRLLDADGTGLGGEKVSLYASNGFQDEQEWEQETDAQGRFAFAGLAAGRFRVSWVRTLGGVEVDDLRQYHEINAEDFETVMQPRGRATVHGTLDFAGKLPEVFEIWMDPVRDESEDPPRSTDPCGRAAVVHHTRFHVEHLVAGEYEVSAYFGLLQGEARVLVPEEGSVEVTVLLERHDN